MKEQIKLKAQARSEQGSTKVNRLRKSGLLPGIIYGTNEPKKVAFDTAEFATLQRHHSSENLMVELDIEGDRTHKVLIREVQHHPVTGRPLHVDFYELAMDKKVRVAVPVECAGTPVGVSQNGGILEQLLREIEVECLPDDIVEEFVIDVSALGVDDGLTVADIPLDASKYELVTDGSVAVVAVAPPRTEEQAAEDEAAEDEPSVIGEKKEEEDTASEKSDDK